MKIDMTAFDDLKKNLEKQMQIINENIDKVPADVKKDFMPYIEAIKKGEKVNINNFIDKMNNHASRYKSI